MIARSDADDLRRPENKCNVKGRNLGTVARDVELRVATLPFALIRGVAGTALGGGVLSLGSLFGFVTVLGIAARNGIMLVSHYRHLERLEGEAFGPGLVLRCAAERLSPILMTAGAVPGLRQGRRRHAGVDSPGSPPARPTPLHGQVPAIDQRRAARLQRGGQHREIRR